MILMILCKPFLLLLFVFNQEETKAPERYVACPSLCAWIETEGNYVLGHLTCSLV